MQIIYLLSYIHSDPSENPGGGFSKIIRYPYVIFTTKNAFFSSIKANHACRIKPKKAQALRLKMP